MPGNDVERNESDDEKSEEEPGDEEEHELMAYAPSDSRCRVDKRRKLAELCLKQLRLGTC